MQHAGCSVFDAGATPCDDRPALKLLLQTFRQLRLSSALQAKGMEISIVEQGRRTLDMLAAPPDVDFILMDIMMPEMDGCTALRKIRENEKIQDVPVIVLTAGAMNGDREKCLEAGADTCLAKPIDMEQLFIMMQDLLAAKIINR